MNRKAHLIPGVILTFVGLGAIPAGLSMIAQPDRTGLGLTTK